MIDGTHRGTRRWGDDQDSGFALRIGEERTGPAVAYVAFPAEHLAAARGFEIMTDYLRAGKRKQKRGEASRSAQTLLTSGVMAALDEPTDEQDCPERGPERGHVGFRA